MTTTYDRVARIVVEQLGVDADRVTPSATFIDDLNGDSLDLVEFTLRLEEEFGIEISDDSADGIETVQDAVDHVERRSA